MNNFKRILIIVCILFFCTTSVKAQDIRINEFVASNAVYFDEDGDTSDWIELYNHGTTATSLLNWGLSDDENELDKWQFPDVTLAPNDYLLVWASKKDRSNISYSRTLVNQGAIFNYLIPTTEPSPSWKTLNFDDSSWQQGASGFGYGDGDDATVLPNGTTSVYTRIKFNVTDIATISSLILDIDFDDGFIAYINGTQIARYNMIGDVPTYNSGTSFDHEAQIYNGGSPDRFLIDNSADILVEGENILTIQVNNVSNTSSDLTLIPFLTAVFSTPSTQGVAPPEVLDLIDRNLHTNFKISSKSETITLSNQEGTVIDQLTAENLQPNISIGVGADDSIAYFLETTPNAVNATNEYTGFLTSDIVFSHQGGIVVSPLTLTLSGNEVNQTIRYTTDATEPTETSQIYTAPISISTNTVVRARLFAPNYIPSLTDSKTYIFNTNHQIDVVTIETDPYNFFDEDYGIYVLGDTYNAQFPFRGANFWEDWERPIHFSFYDKDSGALEIELNAGVKIFGGWSRANEQRSLSIFARGQYGTSEMEYPFFDTLNYDTFQALVLRNSGNDWLSSSIKDVALTSLMEGSGLDFQANNPVATYINGAYWGTYNMREKVNEHMLASKHNIDADDITLLERNAEVIEGSNEEYIELINYISTTDLSDNTNFDYVRDRVDLTNYALYQTAQIFFNNTDWPGNNIKYWKPKGGKWRWILFDTDFGFGPPWNAANYNENTLNFALTSNGPSWPNPPWSTLLFRKLMSNTTFRNQFINRYADELNTRFLPTKVKEHIESVFQVIAPEIPTYYARWGGNPTDALNFVNGMKTFADNRHAIAKTHIKNQFSLPNIHNITISNTDISAGYVKVNDNLKIKEPSWNGDYFETVPISLTAIAENGYEFSHWSGDNTSTTATIEVDLNNATQITANFIASVSVESIVINEINYKSGDAVDPGDWVELYNPTSEAIDVSNWMLKDDDDTNVFNFPAGTMIESDSYLILVKDAADFNTVFPTITNIIGDFDFGLGSKSDAVRIFNADEILQDEVFYDNEADWSDCAKGDGPTFELITPDLDNNLPESWDCSNTIGSPNAANNLPLSVDQFDASNIKLYPNPVTDMLYIKGIETQDAVIKIYNLLGKIVLSEAISNKIDLNGLHTGIYVVRIQNGSNTYNYKLLKK